MEKLRSRTVEFQKMTKWAQSKETVARKLLIVSSDNFGHEREWYNVAKLNSALVMCAAACLLGSRLDFEGALTQASLKFSNSVSKNFDQLLTNSKLKLIEIICVKAPKVS